MAAKMQRRMALRRKLHILRTLTNSKSVKKSSIIKDAFLYIYKLKLQVEAIKQEYHYLINHIQEVKIEKLGAGYLIVRVTCKKCEEMLVSILEAFEEMNVNVVQARVTCKHFFGMEAIVEDNIDATILNEAILKEVKIEKLGAGYLIVRVTCKKCEEMLVSILEAFEEMNVNVVQARVTCKHFFGMEAIVEDNIDATILNEAILKVIQSQTQKCP